MLGAIEAGGTKFVCAVGDEKGNVIDRIHRPTTKYVTLPELSDYIVSPGLRDDAGITRALIFAYQALQEEKEM